MGSRYDTPHDQFVIAYLPQLEDYETVTSHALAIAQMIGKGIILLYIEDPHYGGPTADEATPLLKTIAEQLRAYHADTQYAALRGSTHTILSSLPTLLYGVITIAQVNPLAPRRSPLHPRHVLRNFSESKIAYLTVQRPCKSTMRYTDVAFSIDYRRESKEKLIWASYFARFGKSHLHVFSLNYRDERLHTKWNDNMRFTDKIFASLAITNYSRHTFSSRGLFSEPAAIAKAHTAGCSLLISTTTEGHDRDIIEWFAGTQEQRTIVNPQQLPVLFINPRDDLFVLCD